LYDKKAPARQTVLVYLAGIQLTKPCKRL